MPGFIAAVPLVLSGVKALLKYRARVDTIMSLSEATVGLPFRLPPAPTDFEPHRAAMFAFFRSELGKTLLQVQGLADAFAEVSTAAAIDDPDPEPETTYCYKLYFEAADVRPARLAPSASEADHRKYASTGPDPEMRLAYYVVESHRLSRNPALTRLILATADTLLEFAGENANLFISNPKTRGLVETVIDEFAGKHDFDDDNAEMIFRRLLGAAMIGVLENPEVAPDHPAIKALFGALGDLREKYSDEFVARIVTGEGFQELVSGLLANIAEDPTFITSHEVAKEVVKATLIEVSENLGEILSGDSKAVLGVVEAALTVGAANVDKILKSELQGKPLTTALLVAIGKNVAAKAEENAFFKDLASGEIFADIYKVALKAVAENPDALKTQAGLDVFASDLVVGLASALSETPLKDTLRSETFRALARAGLSSLSRHPEIVARDNKFASQVVAAVFEAASAAIGDGLDKDDLTTVLDAALLAATENLALADLDDDRLKAVLLSVGGAISGLGTKNLLTASGRKDALVGSIQAVVANPVVWGEFAGTKIVQPLVEGLVNGLASDPTKLLSGPVLVDALRRSLTAAAKRGAVILNDGQGTMPATLEQLLRLSLDAANSEIGESIDGENIGDFVERVLVGFLSVPFQLVDGSEEELAKLLRSVIDSVKA